MFQTYEEALHWIHSRLRLGMKPGLKRMEWMMDRLDHPEKKIKTVHVGGTNGKGSTVTFLRNILQAAGLNVGTFTSPYIEQFNERISLNGIPMNNDDLVQLTNRIKPLSDALEETELGGPTEFEVITAISFLYFAECKGVDIVIYEVGLGGRFDSTNIIEPIFSIITSIGLDHTSILGDTYEKIAFEKAGIIKKNTPVISAVKNEGALAVIKEVAEKNQSPFYQLGKEFFINNEHGAELLESFSFSTGNRTVHNLSLKMLGEHQLENASLAVMGALLLYEQISDEIIREGLLAAYWPGRFEIISHDPFVVIDGAHNEEGICALVKTLSGRFPHFDKKLVFAALGDKKFNKMIEKLDKIASSITFVDFDFPRAAKAEELFAASSSQNKDFSYNWQSSIVEILKKQKDGEMLVITGSLYFISLVKPFLLEFLGKK